MYVSVHTPDVPLNFSAESIRPRRRKVSSHEFADGPEAERPDYAYSFVTKVPVGVGREIDRAINCGIRKTVYILSTNCANV